MARPGILERLAQGVVLGDGGYLLELERRGYVQSGPYTPEVSIRHPEALGRHPEASETTPDLSKHPILGTNAPLTWR